MKDYPDELLDKYSSVIEELQEREASGPLGETVDEVCDVAASMGIDAKSSEARDALVVCAAEGEVEMISFSNSLIQINFDGGE